jgi:dihydroxyacetone kinase
MSVAKGFRELQAEWDELLSNNSGDIGEFLSACAFVIMEHCGGASGPIWGSAFRSAGLSCVGKKSLSLSEFSTMMRAAVQGIQTTGERSFGRGAQVGDKTLIDALIPCVEKLEQCAKEGAAFGDAFAAGAEAAAAGAKATEKIVARMGRAGTVGERSIGYPDAGAHALGVIFKFITESLVFESK